MKRMSGIVLLCALLLVACGRQQTAPTTTPVPTTEAPTLTPTATQVVRGTLPPSWTPVGYQTPTPSDTPTPTDTYTPTDTPTATATPTSSDTPTPNLTNVALVNQTLAPICASFAADPQRNASQFTISTAPTIAWTPLSTAATYRLRLYDGNRVTILDQTTTDTSFTFSADLFQSNQTYAWDVAPLDADGVQICPSRGALLLPRP